MLLIISLQIDSINLVNAFVLTNGLMTRWMKIVWSVTIVAKHVLIQLNIHALLALKSITGYNKVIVAIAQMDILKMR